MILDEVICRQFLKDRIRLYTQFVFLITDSYHKIYNDTRTTHSSFTQKIDNNRQCTPHMSLITAHKQLFSYSFVAPKNLMIINFKAWTQIS